LVGLLRNNPNLSDQEKTYLIDNFTLVFRQNAPYMDPNDHQNYMMQLGQRLSKLAIKYKQYPNGCKPDGVECYFGEYDLRDFSIHLYAGDSFEHAIERLKRSGVPGILLHEFFHSLGGVVVPDTRGDLQNSIFEGMTDLLVRDYFGSASGNHYYDTSVAMASVFIELYGVEITREAFFGDDSHTLSKYNLKEIWIGIQARDVVKLFEEINNRPKTLGGQLVNELLQVYVYQLTGKNLLTGKKEAPAFLKMKTGEKITKVAINYFNTDSPNYGGPAKVTIKDKSGKTRTVEVESWAWR